MRWQGITETTTAKCDACGRRGPEASMLWYAYGVSTAYCCRTEACQQRVCEKMAQGEIGLHRDNYTIDEWWEAIVPTFQ